MGQGSVMTSFPVPCSARKPSKFQVRPVLVLAVLVLATLAPARAQGQTMKLLTPTTGWVSNNGHLYWTADSGSNWTDITPIPPNAHVRGVGLRGIFFLNTQEGWAVISYPETVVPLTPQALRTRKDVFGIAQTVDGGQIWSFLPLTYPQLPQWEEALGAPDDMFFLDSLHGWMVMAMTGSSNFAPGKLLATDDGGRNWKWVNGPGTIGTLLFTSTQDGWLAGGPGGLRLYATHDGCKTWQQINLTPPTQIHTSPQAVYEGPPLFVDAQHAYVAARYQGLGGAPSRLVVFATADAGKTWKPAKVLDDVWKGGILDVALADSILIVPSSSSMKAIHVATVHLKGDLTSSVVVSGKGLYGLTFADAAHGLALAESGLLYTSDGGATWKNVTPWHIFRPSPSRTVPAVKHPQAQREATHPETSISVSPLAPG